MSDKLCRALSLAVCCLLWCLPHAQAQESPWLYGIHDHDTGQFEYLNRINNGGAKGWVTATVAIGRNPGDNGGVDFRFISNAGHAVIGRLNHGYGTAGSLPPPQYYADFAQRCANFVANSQGCTVWHIGNEMNLASEWPEVNGYRTYVSPQQVAQCFRLCYDAIKAVRPTHKVLSMPMAPWAGPYGGTAQHDGQNLNWVTYLNQMLTAIKNSTPGPHGTGPDGIALHINSRGYRYEDIHNTQRQNVNGQLLSFSFYVYKDWIDFGIPSSMWYLPLYATECNGNYYWKGGHIENPSAHYEPGWMQEIYAEINRWNTITAPATGKPKFRCVNMYRWCASCDPWNIDGGSNPYKNQILSDLDAAVAGNYRWDTNTPPVADFTGSPTSGDRPLTVNFTDASSGTINSRSWNFGGGGTSTQTSPSHTYTTPGVYTVSLTVSGPGGNNTKTRTNYITVTQKPPTGDFDLDNDVDLDDYARFQRCMSGAGNAQLAPECSRS